MKNTDLESPILVDLMKENLEDRLELIKTHAYSVDPDTVYTRELTKEEVDELKDEYVKNNIQLAKFDGELQRIKEEFKNKMNPLKMLGKEYLEQIRSQHKEVEGTVYNLDDQENKLMITVDEEGNVLSYRPLRKDERQLSINSASKQAM